jgi:hypothetical protein
MALLPVYKEFFLDQLDGDFANLKDEILVLCQRLCENPQALHAYRMKYEYKGYRSADIPKTGGGGRGKDRIIFQINDDLNPSIPKNEIHFCLILDTHQK